MKKLALSILLSVSFWASAMAQQTVEERVTILEGSGNSIQARVTALEAAPPVDLSVLEARLTTLEAIPPVDLSLLEARLAVLEAVPPVDLSGVKADIDDLRDLVQAQQIAALVSFNGQAIRIAVLEAIEPFSIPTVTEFSDQNVPEIPSRGPADLVVVGLPEIGDFAFVEVPDGFHRPNSPIVTVERALVVRVGDGSDPRIPFTNRDVEINFVPNRTEQLRLPAGWMFLCLSSCNN